MVIFDDAIFVHLPKAGGSTVTATLTKTRELRCWMRGHPTLAQVPPGVARGDAFHAIGGKKLIFTVIRHPWSWRRSWFAHMLKNRNSLWPYHPDMWVAYHEGVRTWEQCLQWCLKNRFFLCRNQFPLYYQAPRLRADMILRIEHIEEGLQKLYQRLKWGSVPEIRKRNPGRYADIDFQASRELESRYREAERPIIRKFYP